MSPMNKENSIFRLPLFLGVFLLMSACTTVKSKEQLLLGEWQAQWEAKPQQASEACLQMQGKVLFSADGQAEMIGYGHKDCIFSEDTLQNQLQWTLRQGQLSFRNLQDPFEMDYQIESLSEDHIQLVLMDDIRLHLTR